MQKMIEAAQAGGEVVRNYFGKVLTVEEKTNAGDLRTKADTESEQAILAVIKSAFPDCNIYAEESGAIDNESEYTFVIDPLDGTSNFVLGIPDFAISIGLLKGTESVAGVIYNPILDQMFTAEKGKGAFLNGQPIHVNNESDITRSVVSYTCGYNTDRYFSEKIESDLRDLKVKRILNHWAPAYDYCLLACGKLEAVLSKEGDLEDHVAAKVIVSEAGGKHTGFKNEVVNDKTPDFLTTNGTAIHEVILGIL